jgi:phage/plasmid-like protein (TIGR03299 family)
MLTAPWDGIIKPARTESRTARQVMTDAKLDWRCEEQELRTEAGLFVSSHKAIVRSTDSKILGVVTRGYNILQNAESFSFVDSLVDDGHMTYQGAGTFDDGKSIFIQGRLPEGGEIVPGDVVWPYLAFVNRHDGSGSVTTCLTSVRIVCANTQRAAVKQGRASGNAINIKHTKNMHDRLEQARHVFGWATTNFGDYIKAAKSLVKKNIVSHKALRDFFSNVVQAKSEDIATRTENKIDRLMDLFEVGAGNDNRLVKGTYWAAVNAVTQYIDHEATTRLRGDGMQDLDESARAAAIRAKRFESSQLGAGADIKDRAMELALAA